MIITYFFVSLIFVFLTLSLSVSGFVDVIILLFVSHFKNTPTNAQNHRVIFRPYDFSRRTGGGTPKCWLDYVCISIRNSKPGFCYHGSKIKERHQHHTRFLFSFEFLIYVGSFRYKEGIDHLCEPEWRELMEISLILSSKILRGNLFGRFALTRFC